jgi:hypothetical protein
MPCRPVPGRRSWPATPAGPRHDSAGIGILIPSKQPPGGQEVDLNARPRNALPRSLLCLGECGFALLTVCWRILQHITASPSKISAIARAALILNHFEYGRITWISLRSRQCVPGWCSVLSRAVLTVS